MLKSFKCQALNPQTLWHETSREKAEKEDEDNILVVEVTYVERTKAGDLYFVYRFVVVEVWEYSLLKTIKVCFRYLYITKFLTPYCAAERDEYGNVIAEEVEEEEEESDYDENNLVRRILVVFCNLTPFTRLG